MKEATGELNMTVITLVAIGAIGALFYLFVWPMIQKTIAQQTCNTYGTYYIAEKDTEQTGTDKTSVWKCCPSVDKGAPANITDCIKVDNN